MSPAVDPAALPKTSRVAREQSRRLRKILVCPGCTAHLIAERKEGVEIDRCELCEGIWLDAGEYDAVRHSIEISRGRPPEMNKATADSRDAPIAIALEVIGALLELIP